jgi:ferredoxin
MRKKINRLPLYALLAALALLFCALVSVAFLPFAATDSGFAMPTAVSVVCGVVAVVAVVPLLIALVLRLREARTVLAVIFGLGITLLLLDFTGTVRLWTGWMARIQLLPAVLALSVAVVVPIVLTLVYGRIYCSVICPLGVMQDVIARIGRIGKRRPYNYSGEKRWLRIGVLVLFLILLIGGVGTAATLIAPYSAFGRIAQNLLQPLWIMGNNALASVASGMDSYAFYHTDLWMRSLPTFIIAAVTFLVIAVLAWRGGRTWCNTICPVGTVLGFLSRFSWLKIHFDAAACRNCSKCTRHCKAACIDFKTHTVDYSRCVACGDCLSQCEFDALSYGHVSLKKNLRPRPTSPEAPQGPAADDPKAAGASAPTVAPAVAAAPVDTGRRGFLMAAAMVASTAAMAQKDKKVDGGLAAIEQKQPHRRHTPLTPPGSWSADHFAQHCTACQLCVAECPNGVLRPSEHLDTLMQPTMSYERGFCRPECTRCSSVCPTGAIRPITPADKSSTQIGHAVWMMMNCVVVADNTSCGNCARHCPSGAIEMMPLHPDDPDSLKVPAVNEARCIGCGACEYVCPARPCSAIYVEGHEVHKSI